MKKESRFLAISDAPFKKKDETALIIGVVSLGGDSLVGVLSSKVKVDGDDSTDQIIKMINKSKYYKQIRGIFLKGLSVGGFNVVDIHRLFQETGIPVIVVMKKYSPNLEKIEAILTKLRLSEKLILFQQAGKIHSFYDELYYQFVGLEKKEAIEFLNLTCTTAYKPEPLRLASIIGTGIVKGEG